MKNYALVAMILMPFAFGVRGAEPLPLDLTGKTVIPTQSFDIPVNPPFPFFCNSSATNPRVCEITVTVDLKVNPINQEVLCAVTAPSLKILDKKHRAVKWIINYIGDSGFLVKYPDYPSIPAVALYNDYAYQNWERLNDITFIWRLRRKSIKTSYFVLVQYTKVADPTISGLCALKDPIITNDNED